MNLQIINFPNIGIIKTKLSTNDLEPVWKEVNDILDDNKEKIKFNKNLAGHIKKEFALPNIKDYLNTLLMPYVIDYEKAFGFISKQGSINNGGLQIKLDMPWVNIQEKYEFNPAHNHSGVVSFVIWLKVPYKFEDELTHSPGKDSITPLSGKFIFHYTDILGNILHEPIPIDEDFENVMLMFPASLNHSVYPFYSSDESRISLAGNFRFIFNEDK